MMVNNIQLLLRQVEDAPGYGSMSASSQQRKRLAQESLAVNWTNPAFRRLFPHFKERLQQQVKAQLRDWSKEQTAGWFSRKVDQLFGDRSTAPVTCLCVT